MKHLEAGDPFELVGVSHTDDIDIETDRVTARCIVEDYAMTGFTAKEIIALFGSPSYGLPHGIYLRRGPQFVAGLVEEVFGGAR